MSDIFAGHGWRISMEEAPLPDGRKKKVARVHRCDSVSVIAFVDPEHILLLREFRPFYGTYIWMLPSGRIDKEKDLKGGALRELREETGYSASDLTYYVSSNHSETLVFAHHVFIARGLSLDPNPPKQDADELIEVHKVKLDEAIGKVLQSEFVHSGSAYGLLRYRYENPA